MKRAMQEALAEALGPAPPGLPQNPCIGCGQRCCSQLESVDLNNGNPWPTCGGCFELGADDPGYDRDDLV